MSALSWFSRLSAVIPKFSSQGPACLVPLSQQNQQSRNKWVDCRMIKDAKKRRAVKELGHLKLRLWTLRKCKELPKELCEVAKEDGQAIPRDASYYQVVDRCSLTSKPRGNVVRWRLSRMVFRHLVDYNKMSGVMRARW